MKIYCNPDQSLIIEQSRIIDRDLENREFDRAVIEAESHLFYEPNHSIRDFEYSNHPLPDGTVEFYREPKVELLTHKHLNQWFSPIYDEIGIIGYKFNNPIIVYYCNRDGYIPFVPGIDNPPPFLKGSYKLLIKCISGIGNNSELPGIRSFDGTLTYWGVESSIIGWKPVTS